MTVSFRDLPMFHRVYYHQATFLQLNTITFLLPFPNPFIPSEPSGSRINDSNSMSAFLFEDILPIICCNSLQKVLVFAICGNAPSRRIQSPTMHYQKDVIGKLMKVLH